MFGSGLFFVTHPHIHNYLAMSFPPLFASAPPAHAGPADARSSSVENSPAEEIEEAKMTAVAADTPAAAETAIAADTPAPAPDDQAPAATTQARQAFNVWSLLEGISAEKRPQLRRGCASETKDRMGRLF